MGEKTEEAGKPETRSVKEFESDTNKDSDETVKAPPKKKTKQCVLHDSEDNNDDDGENKANLLGGSLNLKLTSIQIK